MTRFPLPSLSLTLLLLITCSPALAELYLENSGLNYFDLQNNNFSYSEIEVFDYNADDLKLQITATEQGCNYTMYLELDEETWFYQDMQDEQKYYLLFRYGNAEMPLNFFSVDLDKKKDKKLADVLCDLDGESETLVEADDIADWLNYFEWTPKKWADFLKKSHSDLVYLITSEQEDVDADVDVVYQQMFQNSLIQEQLTESNIAIHDVDAEDYPEDVTDILQKGVKDIGVMISGLGLDVPHNLDQTVANLKDLFENEETRDSLYVNSEALEETFLKYFDDIDEFNISLLYYLGILVRDHNNYYEDQIEYKHLPETIDTSNKDSATHSTAKAMTSLLQSFLSLSSDSEFQTPGQDFTNSLDSILSDLAAIKSQVAAKENEKQITLFAACEALEEFAKNVKEMEPVFVYYNQAWTEYFVNYIEKYMEINDVTADSMKTHFNWWMDLGEGDSLPKFNYFVYDPFGFQEGEQEERRRRRMLV